MAGISTIKDCYQYVLNRLNKLSTNYGNSIETYKFTEALNAATLMWAENRIKLDETNIVRTDELQQLLLSKHINGVKSSLNNNYYEFDLPDDYFHYKRSTSFTPCEITNWLKKEANINLLLKDDNWKPSLEWGETLCTIVGNKIRVYVDNFIVEKIHLVYYRIPIQVSMASPDPDINGNTQIDIDPEFKNQNLIEILNITAQILAGDTEDQWNYQITSRNKQEHN